MSAPSFPFPVLLADIGGTNARFRLKQTPGAPPSPMIRLGTEAFPTFSDAAATAIRMVGDIKPRSLIIGAAGPVIGRRVHLTNARWTIDGAETLAALGLDQGLLLNDFETLALTVPALGRADWEPLGPDLPATGLAAVVGPGTGLGVGAVREVNGAILPLSSEGGHVALSPGTDEEARLLAAFNGRLRRISAETALAGPGIARIADALAITRGAAPPGWSPADVVAHAGQDPLATDAIRLWLDLLARCCGDLALTFFAEGGVYLAGGILPRVAGLIDGARFHRLFSEHPTHGGWLGQRAIRLITAAEPAFIGLSALADAPERHLLAYGERLWRV